MKAYQRYHPQFKNVGHPYMPMPVPSTGELFVDPEIRIRAKGFDFELSLYYSTEASLRTDAPIKQYGNQRLINLARRVVSESGTEPSAYVLGGDFVQVSYIDEGSGYEPDPSNLAVRNSLAKITSPDQFVEKTPDGFKFIYGNPVSVDTDTFSYSLVALQDVNGNTQTISYGTGVEDGLIKTVTVPGGNKVTFVYQPATDGVIASLLYYVEDWGGRKTTFQYDSNGNLTTLIAASGCITKYQYTLPFSKYLISGIEDPHGYLTTYAFDSLNRVTTMMAGGATWTYEYPPTGSWPPNGLSVAISPTGARTTYAFAMDGVPSTIMYPEGYILTCTYDDNGFLVQEIMPHGDIVSQTLDSSGRVLAKRDALGNATTFQYNSSTGDVTTITNALGGVVTQTFDANRNMIGRTDELGRYSAWIYDGEGLVSATVDPRGLRTTFTYDSKGNLETIKAPNGSVLTQTFDSLNRVVSITDGLGRVTQFRYDAGDRVVSQINANGEVYQFMWDGCHLVAEVTPLNHRTTYTYNRFGKRATVKDALGFVTTFSYDVQGNLTTITNADGKHRVFAYNAAQQLTTITDELGQVTTLGYDSSGRRIRVTNPRGAVTTTVYNARNDVVTMIDALGNATQQYFDELGRQVSTKSPAGNQTTVVFDAAGQVIAQIDALGNRTTMAYNASGLITTITDALLRSAVTAYQADSNWVLSQTTPGGEKTTFTYNTVGQLVSVTQADGGVFEYYYDSGGRLEIVEDPYNNTRTWGYDGQSRVTSFEDELGHMTVFSYDELNRNIATTSPEGNTMTSVFDKLGRRIAAIDPGGNRFTTSFDALGRPVPTVNPAGNISTIVYGTAGNPTTFINARGFSMVYAFDLDGQVVTATDALGSISTYVWDADGRQTSIVDPAGGRTTYVYTSRNQIEALVDPLGNRTTFTYDAARQQATRKFANGDVTSYTFDANGRLVTMQYADGKRVTLQYSAMGNLTTMADTNGTTTMSYDLLQRMTAKTDTYGLVQTNQFDVAGRRTTLILPDSNIITYSFNDDNRITEIIETGNKRTTLAYDPRGYVTTVTFPSGRVQASTIDASGRHTVQKDTNGATVLQLFTYTFDSNGNRITVKDSNGGTTTYTFDGKDRLTLDQTTGTDAHTYTYTYDSRDNIRSSTESGALVTFNYDASSRLTTSTSAGTISTYTFDSNGNLTNVQTGTTRTTLTWDKENRLLSWSRGSSSTNTNWKYNGMGQKIYEQTGTAVTTPGLVWDGNDLLGQVGVGESDPWVFLNSIRSAAGVIYARGDDFMVDYLGSVTGVTNKTTGAVSSTYRYKPYGAKLSGDTIGVGFYWTGNTGSRTTGKEYAEQYNRARHYSSLVHQWISRDPLWPRESAFQYGLLNPISFIDPFGQGALPLPLPPVLPPGWSVVTGGGGAAAGGGLGLGKGVMIPPMYGPDPSQAGNPQAEDRCRDWETKKDYCDELKQKMKEACGKKMYESPVGGGGILAGIVVPMGPTCSGERIPTPNIQDTLNAMEAMEKWCTCAKRRKEQQYYCFASMDAGHLRAILFAEEQCQKCRESLGYSPGDDPIPKYPPFKQRPSRPIDPFDFRSSEA